jgi:hypothetical protein
VLICRSFALPSKVALAIAGCTLFLSARANAQAGPPAGHEEAAFDVMNLLSQRGLHNLDDERWNLYGQLTYISSWKLPFKAPYTNANGSTNSLLPGAERSFTGTFSLFFGLKLWPGGEAYLVPEVVSEQPLSQLHGIGGSIQNFELQKTGSETPHLYRARLFLRQTLGLGGDRVVKSSDPLQLGTVVDSRRFVLTLGNFSMLDVFDRNSVTGDPPGRGHAGGAVRRSLQIIHISDILQMRFGEGKRVFVPPMLQTVRPFQTMG